MTERTYRLDDGRRAQTCWHEDGTVSVRFSGGTGYVHRHLRAELVQTRINSHRWEEIS